MLQTRPGRTGLPGAQPTCRCHWFLPYTQGIIVPLVCDHHSRRFCKRRMRHAPEMNVTCGPKSICTVQQGAHQHQECLIITMNDEFHSASTAAGLLTVRCAWHMKSTSVTQYRCPARPRVRIWKSSPSCDSMHSRHVCRLPTGSLMTLRGGIVRNCMIHSFCMCMHTPGC